MEEGEVAPQIMPLVVIPADTSEGGPRGATPGSVDHHGRPTRGSDAPHPRSTVCSLSPRKTQKPKTRERSSYRRPSKDNRAPWTTTAKLLLKESVAATSNTLPPTEPKTPQDCRPVSGQGISPNPTPDRKGKGIAIDSSPQKDTRRKAKEQEKDLVTYGLTMADLIAMV